MIIISYYYIINDFLMRQSVTILEFFKYKVEIYRLLKNNNIFMDPKIIKYEVFKEFLKTVKFHFFPCCYVLLFIDNV